MARRLISNPSRIAGFAVLAATVTAISALPAGAQGYNPLNPYGTNGPLGGNRAGGPLGGNTLSPYQPPQTSAPAARSGAAPPVAAQNFGPAFTPLIRQSVPPPPTTWWNYNPLSPVVVTPGRRGTPGTVTQLSPASPATAHAFQQNSNPLNPYVPSISSQSNPGFTPSDGHRHHRRDRDGDFFYGGGGGITIVTDGPPLLGGYYYGNYCASPWNNSCYPTVFSYYSGFPQYTYNPSVIVLSQPYYPAYTTPYTPFYAPPYQVTYNQINYYVDSDRTADQIQQGGDPAQKAITEAFPADSYEAAFADIEKAWNDGNIALLRKHLRDSDTKIAVSLKSKYRYSIASDDFEQITKDALDRLNTVSFKFKGLRKAKNGDVTAYAVHTYRGAGDDSGTGANDGAVVPFDTDKPNMETQDDTGEAKTVYVSYTLRKHNDMWYIIAVDSSTTPLIVNQDEAAS